jgi:hypothetical protein
MFHELKSNRRGKDHFHLKVTFLDLDDYVSLKRILNQIAKTSDFQVKFHKRKKGQNFLFQLLFLQKLEAGGIKGYPSEKIDAFSFQR